MTDAPCDILLWQESGYPDSPSVRRKFAKLSQISYKMGREREKLINDFNKTNDYDFEIIKTYSDRDRMVVHDKPCNKVIMVFRGTDIKNQTMNRNRDMLANVYIALGFTNISARFREVESVLKKVITKYGKDAIILTGHSMGGKIAYELSKRYRIPSISFNQFSTPLNKSANDLGVHFNTNRFRHFDPLSVSSSVLDRQKEIKVDIKANTSAHTIENFI